MSVLEHLGNGLTHFASFWPLITVAAGVMLGILAGALPGLSPSMGVALLVPLTWSWSPEIIQILSLIGTYGLSLILIIIFPKIALWLPTLLYGQ